jgi:hypothetical protein
LREPDGVTPLATVLRVNSGKRRAARPLAREASPQVRVPRWADEIHRSIIRHAEVPAGGEIMKRVVTGPNGIMTVYGNEHLTDEQLIALAQQLAAEKDALIQVSRKALYASALPSEYPAHD